MLRGLDGGGKIPLGDLLADSLLSRGAVPLPAGVVPSGALVAQPTSQALRQAADMAINRAGHRRNEEDEGSTQGTVYLLGQFF